MSLLFNPKPLKNVLNRDKTVPIVYSRSYLFSPDMKKILPAFLSLAAVSYLLAARSRPSLASAGNNTTLLWEITGKGISKPSYLLGTIHVLCAEDAVLSKAVKTVIRQVRTIYLEMDMNFSQEAMAEMLATANQSNPNLSDVLSAEEYEQVKLFFEQHKPAVPFPVLEKQHPIMISSGLYELLIDCDHTKGVETVLLEEAMKHRKSISGLETVAFQASLFKEISFAEQARELVKAISNLPRQKELLNELMMVYKAQDLERLYELSTHEEAGTSAFLDILVHQRNRDWAQKIGEFVKKGSSLFAVGAGHLGGPHGVLKLLREMGFNMRPLSN